MNEDKYVRPPMEEPVRRIGPIDIILIVMAVICLVALMWSMILFSPCDVKDLEEKPVETVETVETTFVTERILVEAEAVEIGAFESPVLTVEEEPTVMYYDVPLDDKLQDHIFAMCDIYSIDPALVLAVIENESNYRDWVVGDNGRSFGLMQIQPRWHWDRMDELGVTDLLDPYQNIIVGIDYLYDLFQQCEDVEWVLMAYNGGPSYANNMVNRGVVSAYATDVLEGARELRGVG